MLQIANNNIPSAFQGVYSQLGLSRGGNPQIGSLNDANFVAPQKALDYMHMDKPNQLTQDTLSNNSQDTSFIHRHMALFIILGIFLVIYYLK